MKFSPDMYSLPRMKPGEHGVDHLTFHVASRVTNCTYKQVRHLISKEGHLPNKRLMSISLRVRSRSEYRTFDTNMALAKKSYCLHQMLNSHNTLAVPVYRRSTHRHGPCVYRFISDIPSSSVQAVMGPHQRVAPPTSVLTLSPALLRWH